MNDSGQASDQILGRNNIGDRPLKFVFHARPSAVKHRYPNRCIQE
jgi:hypothetical protein